MSTTVSNSLGEAMQAIVEGLFPDPTRMGQIRYQRSLADQAREAVRRSQEESRFLQAYGDVFAQPNATAADFYRAAALAGRENVLPEAMLGFRGAELYEQGASDLEDLATLSPLQAGAGIAAGSTVPGMLSEQTAAAQRQRIAAGPGYASVAQRRHEFEAEPLMAPVTDPETGETQYVATTRGEYFANRQLFADGPALTGSEYNTLLRNQQLAYSEAMDYAGELLTVQTPDGVGTMSRAEWDALPVEERPPVLSTPTAGDLADLGLSAEQQEALQLLAEAVGREDLDIETLARLGLQAGQEAGDIETLGEMLLPPAGQEGVNQLRMAIFAARQAGEPLQRERFVSLALGAGIEPQHIGELYDALTGGGLASLLEGAGSDAAAYGVIAELANRDDLTPQEQTVMQLLVQDYARGEIERGPEGSVITRQGLDMRGIVEGAPPPAPLSDAEAPIEAAPTPVVPGQGTRDEPDEPEAGSPTPIVSTPEAEQQAVQEETGLTVTPIPGVEGAAIVELPESQEAQDALDRQSRYYQQQASTFNRNMLELMQVAADSGMLPVTGITSHVGRLPVPSPQRDAQVLLTGMRESLRISMNLLSRLMSETGASPWGQTNMAEFESIANQLGQLDPSQGDSFWRNAYAIFNNYNSLLEGMGVQSGGLRITEDGEVTTSAGAPLDPDAVRSDLFRGGTGLGPGTTVPTGPGQDPNDPLNLAPLIRPPGGAVR